MAKKKYYQEQFNPDDCDRDDLRYIADQISIFQRELLRKAIILDELKEEVEKQMAEGNRRVKKLIKKLKKGDTSVFRDDVDY